MFWQIAVTESVAESRLGRYCGNSFRVRPMRAGQLGVVGIVTRYCLHSVGIRYPEEVSTWKTDF